jgi:hypothetical protein
MLRMSKALSWLTPGHGTSDTKILNQESLALLVMLAIPGSRHFFFALLS